MIWDDIVTAPRHGLGQEQISSDAIIPSIPAAFEGQEKFLALRYHDNLPMVGIRSNEVFHILWIERQYGEVYNHGD